MGGSGGGKGGSAPSPGQFGSAAYQQSQGQYARDYLGQHGSSIAGTDPGSMGSQLDAQARANAGFYNAATPTQTNAFGVTSQYGQNPDGTFTQKSSFGGPLGDAVNSMGSQAASAWGQPLDNGAQARQHAQDAIYGQETSRLDPQWQQRQHNFQTQMANQGIDPNSAAYGTASGNLNRAQNDAYQQANYGSIIGGGQEAQRQQQMDLTSRFAPLQGLSGAAGLTGQSANPILPAAIAQYQAQLQKYGIDQQGKNSTMGGISNLGGSAMMAAALSDERYKPDGHRSSRFEQLPGVPFATFRRPGYGSKRFAGVMAQDLEAAGYGHLVMDVGGIKMVDTAANPMVAPVEIDE